VTFTGRYRATRVRNWPWQLAHLLSRSLSSRRPVLHLSSAPIFGRPPSSAGRRTQQAPGPGNELMDRGSRRVGGIPSPRHMTSWLLQRSPAKGYFVRSFDTYGEDIQNTRGRKPISERVSRKSDSWFPTLKNRRRFLTTIRTCSIRRWISGECTSWSKLTHERFFSVILFRFRQRELAAPAPCFSWRFVAGKFKIGTKNNDDV